MGATSSISSQDEMLLYQKVRHILDEDKNGSGEVSDKEGSGSAFD
jgi:hypothetical protein